MALSLINQSDINPLKRLYNEASSGAYPWFNETDWQFALKDTDNNGAENYLSAILSSRKLPFNQDKVKYLDSSSRISYLYNQILRENVEDESKKQEYQNVINEIEQYNEQLKEQYYRNVKDKERANMNFFEALGPNTAGFGANLGAGILETWDRIKNGIVAGSMWIADQIVKDSDKTWADTLSELGVINQDSLTEEDIAALDGKVKDKDGNYVDVPEDEKLLLRTSTLQKGMDDINRSIAEWEADHTSYRNYDGSYNYKSFQSALGSVFSQVGRVQGNMLAIAPLSVISPHLSTAALYTSFGISDATETYRTFRESGVSINATQIILNSTIKMIAQRAIEGGLEFVLGPDVLARTLLGRKGTGIIKTNVSNLAAKRFLNTLKGMGEEALEEVLQDTSDFLINKATAVLVEESAYNDLVDISFNGMMNTAVVAALSALLGSSFETIRTKNILAGSQINILQKMASAQLNIDLSSVAQSLQKLETEIQSKYLDLFGFESVDKLTPENIKEALKDLDENERNKIFTEVQKLQNDVNTVTSLTNIAKQVLDDMGEQGLQSAINNLNVIKQKAEEGYFDLSDVQMAADAANYIVEQVNAEIDFNLLKRKLKENNDKKVLATIKVKNGHTVTDANVDQSISEAAKKVDQLLLNNENVNEVVLTDSGSSFVIGDTAVISKEQLDNSIEDTNNAIAEDRIYELVRNNPNLSYIVSGPDFIKLGKQVYKEMFGIDCDDSTAVYTLLFDAKGFHSALVSGNKDSYKLLTSLLYIEKSMDKKYFNKIEKEKIKSIKTMWINELINYSIFNPNADISMYLSSLNEKVKTEVLNKVKIGREYADSTLYYKTNVYGVNAGYDTYIEKKINYIFGKDEAEKKINLLKNKNFNNTHRIALLSILEKEFDNRYYSGYDGKTYLPDNSIANRVFNNYLKSINKNLKTFLSVSDLSESEYSEIKDIYGEVNNGTLLNYRLKILKESTNDVYSFEKLKNGNVNILYDGEVKGFSKLADIIAKKDDSMTDKAPLDIERRSKYLDSFLNENLAPDVKASISISDMIENPNNLSEETKKNILSFAKDKLGIESKIVTEELSYYFFNDWLNNHSKTYCLLYTRDGYALGKFGTIETLVKQDTLNKKENIKSRQEFDAEKFVQDKYRIAGVKVVFDPKYEGYADYDSSLRTITINNRKVKMSDETMEMVFFHEYFHVLSEYNNGIKGFDNTAISKLGDKAYGIISDMKKHLPEIFEKYDATLEFVSDLIYKGTGEIYAYGYGGTTTMDFIPFIVLKNKDDKILVYTPWGSVYDTSNGNVYSSASLSKFEISGKKFIKSADDLFDYKVKQIISSSDENYRTFNLKIPNVKDIMSFNENDITNSLSEFYSIELKKEANQKRVFEIIKASTGLNDEQVANIKIPVLTCFTEISEFHGILITSANNNYSSYMQYLSSLNPNEDIRLAMIGVSDIKDIVKIGEQYYFVLDISDKTINAKSILLDNIYFETSYPEYNNSIGEQRDIQSMAAPRHDRRKPYENAYDMYDKRYKKALKENKNIINNSSKGIPKIDENGNQMFDKTGKPIYVYPEVKRRSEVTKKTIRENPKFKGFSTRASRVTMSEETFDFINKSHDLPSFLQDKINDGTLKRNDVMSYFRDTENINDSTFSQINNAYFNNKYIKTNEQLNNLVNMSADVYAKAMTLYEMIKVANEHGRAEDAEKLQKIFYSKDEKVVNKFFEQINNDKTLKNLYDKYYKKYDTFHDIRMLMLNNKTLRMAYMNSYEGDLASAGKLLSMVRYLEVHNRKQTGTDYGTRIDETTAENEFELMESDLTADEMTEQLRREYTIEKFNELINDGVSERDARLRAVRYAISEINDDLDESQLRKLYIERFGKQISNDESFELDDVKNVQLLTSQKLKNRLDSKLNRFYLRLTGNEKKRFIKENSDIFDSYGKLNRELYIVKGKLDFDKLNELTKKIDSLISDFDASYKSVKSTNTKLDELEKELRRIKKEMERKPKTERVTVTKTEVQTSFVVKDEIVTIKTTQKVPEKLKNLMSTVFSKRKETMVQEVTPENTDHAVKSMNEFYEQNNDILQSLSKEEALEIVEFFATEPESTNVLDYEAQYGAVRLYTLSYILRQNKLGFFSFTEDELRAIESKIQPKVSMYATSLIVWRNCLKYLRTEESTIRSCMKNEKINFADEDIAVLTRALQTNNLDAMNAAKEKMYNDAIKKYGNGKKDFLTKLYNFEKASMLSSPSTWFRNYTSNHLVTITNKAASKFGSFVGSKVLDKIFKKSSEIKGYKIVGTKITDEVKAFTIQQKIGELFELTADGLSKYDIDRRNKQKYPLASDIVVDMVTRAIEQEFRLANQTDNKYINKAINFVYKMISDDKFIKTATLDYFQKMLVEDKTDLSKGLSEAVLRTFVNAYKTAAFDYMHTTNFINNIELALKQHIGDKAFIAYKQIFPFLAPSYNWFIEGLRLTPAGLVKSIVDYARLEKKIQAMDEKIARYEDQGKTLETYDKSFAKYMALRNIGKGMIGSIGFAAACLFAGFGIIKLRKDDDDEYVMSIGNFDVNISSLYGTTGFTLGLTLTGGIRDFAKGDKQFWTIVTDVFNKFAENSLIQDFYNTFRFSGDMGDAIGKRLSNIPMMLIPNAIKTTVGATNIFGINYDRGFLKILEQYLAKVFPYFLPKYVDPYTGRKMTIYGGSTNASYATAVFANIINKFTELEIKPNIYSDAEKEAIALGISKSQLTGNYKEKKLSGKDKTKINEYYGNLNSQSLDSLMSSKKTYTVEDEKGNRVDLRYNKMSDVQKRSVITRIMSNNASITRIWYFTNNGYKYYTSESEYNELKKLGITNVYKKTSNKEGLIK